MANEKLTALSAITRVPSNSVIYIVDGSSVSKKITGANLTMPLRGHMKNGKLSVSVATNDLTVAIKTLAGADPSTSDPVFVTIGDVEHTLIAALSVTALDATNWCNAGGAELATLSVGFFTYLGYNATDGVVIGFSRKPNATRYDDFSATSTNEKFCKISTITTAAASDAYENIGYFHAILSAGAGYTWTLPATSVVVSSPTKKTRLLLFTPQFTNLTVGDGSLVGRYQTDGVKTFIDISYIFGPSTSAIGGDVDFTPPFSADYVAGAISPLGIVIFRDTGSTQYQGSFYFSSSTAFNIRVINSTVTYARQDAISATVPHTWANTDQLLLNGQYIQG